MGFNLFKAIGGAAVGFLTGGPAGAVVGGVAKGFSARAPSDSTIITQRGIVPWQTTQTRIYTQPSMPISNYPVGSEDGPPIPYSGPSGNGMNCPTGYRANKSTYVTRGGGTSHWPQGLQLHPKGSTCVKRRKLNPGNGKAATHAVHRLVAFYRLSNRVAKQLRRAATKAHIGGRRGQRRLSSGRNVEVVNVE